MVRQLMVRSTTWKAAVILLIAGGGLLWHVLACVESPMAFSPDGKDLAFVTMEPHDNRAMAAGQAVFRLIILTERKELRVWETTAAEMLTAPAYSPDGRYLCYLRLPRLSAEAAKKLQQIKPQTAGSRDQAALETDVWPENARPGEAQRVDKIEDLTLPLPLEKAGEGLDEMRQGRRVPATLILRDSQSGEMVSRTLLELPMSTESNVNDWMLLTYLTLRPQFSPDGQWIYLGVNHLVLAVNPTGRQQRVLAFPALITALSPDGKTIATLCESFLGLIDTQGAATIYRRWDKTVSLSGLCWLSNDTLAVLEPGKDKAYVHLVGLDGQIQKSIRLELPAPPSGSRQEDSGELAIAPDGKHMVISYGAHIFFLSGRGKMLQYRRTEEHELLVRPVFTPDSKLVAFKSVRTGTDKDDRTAAIVFFTPKGKEMSRTEIPPVTPLDPPPVARHVPMNQP